MNFCYRSHKNPCRTLSSIYMRECRLSSLTGSSILIELQCFKNGSKIDPSAKYGSIWAATQIDGWNSAWTPARLSTAAQIVVWPVNKCHRVRCKGRTFVGTQGGKESEKDYFWSQSENNKLRIGSGYFAEWCVGKALTADICTWACNSFLQKCSVCCQDVNCKK